jgi:hypothetical protein
MQGNQGFGERPHLVVSDSVIWLSVGGGVRGRSPGPTASPANTGGPARGPPPLTGHLVLVFPTVPDRCRSTST